MALAIVVQGVTAAWSVRTSVALTNGWAELVTPTAARAVVIYLRDGHLYAKRSGDAGVTWTHRSHIAAIKGRDQFATGGRGTGVDVILAGVDKSVIYVRSVDGGATFKPPVVLDDHAAVYGVSVVRGSNGVVAAAWSSEADGIVTRIGRNGGLTFSAPAIAVEHAGGPIGLAIAGGTLYLAYGATNGSDVLLSRRSISGGVWTDPVEIGSAVEVGTVRVTAAGDSAYVAYGPYFAIPSDGVHVVGTSDGGETWGDPLYLGEPAQWTQAPVIDLDGGILRFAFSRCTEIRWVQEEYGGTYDCFGDLVEYAESSDGFSFSTPVGAANGVARGVGTAGKPLLLFESAGHLYSKSWRP